MIPIIDNTIMDESINDMIIKKKNLKHIISIQNTLYNLLIHYTHVYIPLPNIKIILVNPEFYLHHNILQMEKYIYEIDIINKKLLYDFFNNDFYNNDAPVYTNESDIFDNLLDLFPKDIMSSDIDISDISDIL
tara:strand:+ start:108 stop:506 length:399 start_codon:yes stop_codon:yes gene_type:complete